MVEVLRDPWKILLKVDVFRWCCFISRLCLMRWIRGRRRRGCFSLVGQTVRFGAPFDVMRMIIEGIHTCMDLYVFLDLSRVGL